MERVLALRITCESQDPTLPKAGPTSWISQLCQLIHWLLCLRYLSSVSVTRNQRSFNQQSTWLGWCHLLLLKVSVFHIPVLDAASTNFLGNIIFMSNDSSEGHLLQLELMKSGGIIDNQGFPVAQTVKNPHAMWKTWVQSLACEDPLEEGMSTHSSILAWRIPMDRGTWRLTVHEVAKSWDMTEWLSACARARARTHTHTDTIDNHSYFLIQP